MGRNPVVGRQGPAYHAAKIPTGAFGGPLRVTQIRSASGHAETMRRTLRALGLRGYQRSNVVPDNASTRGMLFKVRHLVEVAPAKET